MSYDISLNSKHLYITQKTNRYQEKMPVKMTDSKIFWGLYTYLLISFYKYLKKQEKTIDQL